MGRLLVTLFGRCIAVGIIAIVAYSGYVYWRVAMPVDAKSEEQIVFVIKSGDRLPVITEKLYGAGLIGDKGIFELYARVSGRSSRVQAGEYTLTRAMAMPEILVALTAPAYAKERVITTIEGWTIQDVAVYLENQGVVSREDFLGALKRVSIDHYPFLRTGTTSVEGYLFPDTYRIFEGATADEIVAKMLDNFGAKYTPSMEQEGRGAGRSIHEIVTMASIVEREVRSEEDKAMVADIFYRRMAQGMPLQSDATVGFVTGKKSPQASYDDLEVDSRYNTYKYKGLPPGPIGNPGLTSIRAALAPKENPYLFFLTTLDDGRVIYSSTYEEHLAAKRKYLDGRNSAKDAGTAKKDVGQE